MNDVAADAAKQAVERVFSEHWGRLLALLTGQLRSLEIAEESLADAFEQAVRHWERDGVPDRPKAWLLTTARRRGLDRLRREATLARKLPLLVVDTEPERGADAALVGEEADAAAIPDERLRLLFTCCHPALASEARVALTLRMVGGLTTAEIARAFLVSEPTMAARITRAKKKVATAGIPYRVPTDADLPDRLGGVLAVLYLVFTEGHSATSGASPVRAALCEEAIRLTRVVSDLLPTEPEPAALLALMLLHHSRRDARTDDEGQLVLLADQDRSRWNRAEIEEGVAFVEHAASFRRVSAYLLQAAIAAEHASARSAAETDWAAIVALYERLERLTGSPVVRLNRAVAVAEREGPDRGFALLAGLDEVLGDYQPLRLARADFLRRMGERAAARLEYARARDLAGNDAERAFLSRRLAELDAD
ncbi:RNA polymerase sigma factor [Actinopolymorpha pittospori]|uniref:RNA polymerase sigma-70 factor (ECF subfamily) n=1 Tax=Actinopolymorpha pittospori TaxID=648752 RepID=A0A927N3U0_9ACTN|nr:RNA polymerase sigma-70 factor (ECF subfamily) [Actinopolymorpha pittospori]